MRLTKLPKNKVQRTISIVKKKIRRPQKIVPKYKLEPYVHEYGIKSRPSFTEEIIMKVLSKYKVNFHREVSFRGFGNIKSPYRFDFYLPDKKVVIEYDGKQHKQKEMQEKDRIKNDFCKRNNIKIYRFNIQHYDKLEFHIKKLIDKLKY